jgi:hypothetical protein
MTMLRKTIFMLLAVFAIGVVPAAAQQQSNTSLALCKNINYALCAASTCEPTGREIAVNKPEGGTRNFKEAKCTCPVLPAGDTGAIANLAGGNMQGSCDSQPGNVWSLYYPLSAFPQKIYGWNTHAARPNTTCTADLGLGRKYANCFSFKCENIRTVTSADGTPVQLADCYCPLGEDVFSALPTKRNTAFFTYAGGDLPTESKRQEFCYKYPVGGF